MTLSIGVYDCTICTGRWIIDILTGVTFLNLNKVVNWGLIQLDLCMWILFKMRASSYLNRVTIFLEIVRSMNISDLLGMLSPYMESSWDVLGGGVDILF